MAHLAITTDGICGSWSDKPTELEALTDCAKILKQDWRMPDDYRAVINTIEIPDDCTYSIRGLVVRVNGKPYDGEFKTHEGLLGDFIK